jgi:hypothetical protein
MQRSSGERPSPVGTPVTDRHEVSRRPPIIRDSTFELLSEIEAQPDQSQRSLALHLGIALGLTNSLVRGLIRRGWVRAVNIKPHRVRYLLTPAGVAEKPSRASRRSGPVSP